jgi:hypothetical protein
MIELNLDNTPERNKMSQEEFLKWKAEVETRLRILEAAVIVIQANVKRANS